MFWTVLALAVLVWLLLFPPVLFAANLDLEQYNNLNSVRYKTPDKIDIINRKDCAHGPLQVCKTEPKVLEESCRGCKQLNAQCVHFDADTPIERDGIQQTLKANAAGEGYCLIDYIEPTASCNVWGMWILTQLNDDSYAWLCKCKYPNIFGQKTLWDDCTEQKACVPGKLLNTELGLPSKLECVCDAPLIKWQDQQSPQCRQPVMRDGAFFDSTTLESYFSFLYEKNLEYMLSRLPAAFNMPDVYVFNPFFLALQSMQHGFEGVAGGTTGSQYNMPSGDKEQYLTTYMDTNKYPLPFRNPFIGPEMINASVHVQQDKWTQPIKTHMPHTLVYTKIIINPEDEPSWFEQPWGWLYGSFTNAQRNKQSIHGYSVPRVDPAKDVFEGQLGIMPLDNGLWVWSPLLRPPVFAVSSFVVDEKVIMSTATDVFPPASKTSCQTINVVDNASSKAHYGLVPLYFVGLRNSEVSDGKVYDCGGTYSDKWSELERFLAFSPTVHQRKSLATWQAQEDADSSWKFPPISSTFRFSYPPRPIPTGDPGWTGNIVCMTDNVDNYQALKHLYIHPIWDGASSTVQARTWTARYYKTVEQFREVMGIDNVTPDVVTPGLRIERGTGLSVQTDRVNTTTQYLDERYIGNHRLNTSNFRSHSTGWENYNRYPFPHRWGDLETMWSPPLSASPLKPPTISIDDSYNYQNQGNWYNVSSAETVITDRGTVVANHYMTKSTWNKPQLGHFGGWDRGSLPPGTIIGTNGNSTQLPDDLRPKKRKAITAAAGEVSAEPLPSLPLPKRKKMS